MVNNIKDPIRTKKQQNTTHDQVIEATAVTAAREGRQIDVCPYTYDLRAKKIWIKAYNKEKRRVRKANSQNGAA